MPNDLWLERVDAVSRLCPAHNWWWKAWKTVGHMENLGVSGVMWAERQSKFNFTFHNSAWFLSSRGNPLFHIVYRKLIAFGGPSTVGVYMCVCVCMCACVWATLCLCVCVAPKAGYIKKSLKTCKSIKAHFLSSLLEKVALVRPIVVVSLVFPLQLMLLLLLLLLAESWKLFKWVLRAVFGASYWQNCSLIAWLVYLCSFNESSLRRGCC